MIIRKIAAHPAIQVRGRLFPDHALRTTAQSIDASWMFRNRGPCLPLHLMQRYHFDLVHTEDVTNVTGAILEDDGQAEKVAHSLATDVRAARPDFIGKGCEIVVRTEDGNEIFRVSIDRSPKRTNGP